MRELLQETVNKIKRNKGLDLRDPSSARGVFKNSETYQMYVDTLSEGLTPADKVGFQMLAENTRVHILENSMFNINPYNTFLLPILRKFYPKLIAKELVTFMPIDKPNVVKYFLNAKFKKYESDSSAYGDYDYTFPSTSTDISRGPATGIQVSGRDANPGATVDILSVAGLSSTNSHVEKDFKIVAFTDATSDSNSVTITPDVEGNFSTTVTSDGGQTDVISGHVNWYDGTFTWSSASGEVTEVSWQAVCSLEENTINPKTQIDLEPIRFVTVDRRLSADWTVNFEQDVKALFDLELQSELISVIGDQIALDIDREIISAIISANSAMNPATHVETFDKTPPATFTWGTKSWYENILPPLNNLSAQIYNSSLLGAGNVLACNPLDAAIFQSLNTFAYTGTAVENGDVGYQSATVAGGSWKILISSVVPQGTIIDMYRSTDILRSVYVYAPYQPLLLMPYPLGNNPSLTIMTRYSTKVIRSEGIGVLSVIET